MAMFWIIIGIGVVIVISCVITALLGGKEHVLATDEDRKDQDSGEFIGFCAWHPKHGYCPTVDFYYNEADKDARIKQIPTPKDSDVTEWELLPIRIMGIK